MTKNIPTKETPRLRLRAFRDTDAEALHQIVNEENVLRYFPNPGPRSLDWSHKLIAYQLNHWQDHGHGWWAVDYLATGELIGWNGLQYLPETEEVEIGYLLARPFWGQGLATEGARVGLQFGFEDLALAQIIAIVHPGNRASQRVIEKLGMAFVDPNHYFGIDVYRYTLERSTFFEGADK